MSTDLESRPAVAVQAVRRSRRPLAMWAGGVAIVAAVGSLIAGSTLGLFSSTPGGETNSFTAGTVTLSSDASGACTVTALMPGDTNASAPCTFAATYSGTADAYLGLDVLIETQKTGVVGAHNAYDPGVGGITVAVVDNQGTPVTYTVPGAAASVACPGGAPAGSTCYQLTNELVNTSVFTSASSPVTFKTTVTLPSSAGNEYQGSSAQIILTAHAVQAKNQTLPSCTAGQVCAGTGTFSWT